MENLLLILVVLFAVLFLLVTVLEKSGSTMSEEQQSKLSRWILPLVALLLVAQLIRYLMG